jgi:hypothetical protein
VQQLKEGMLESVFDFNACLRVDIKQLVQQIQRFRRVIWEKSVQRQFVLKGQRLYVVESELI